MKFKDLFVLFSNSKSNNAFNFNGNDFCVFLRARNCKERYFTNKWQFMMCFLFTKSLYKQNWNLVKVTLIPSKNHAKFSAEKILNGKTDRFLNHQWMRKMTLSGARNEVLLHIIDFWLTLKLQLVCTFLYLSCRY